MSETPRLAPIDRPSSLLGRLMSWAMRWQLGKVIMPARVVYNRIPRMWNVSWALLRLDMHGLDISHELALLIHVRVALRNGCAFCADIAKARAVQEKLGLEKFEALSDWRERSSFSDRERAVLAYIDEINDHLEVDDATFERLRAHLSEREIAEVTVMNALENFYNRINKPLRIPSDELLEPSLQRAA